MMLILHENDNEAEDGHIVGGTIAVRDGRQVTKLYEVGLHDTHETDGGLLAVRETEVDPLSKAIIRRGPGRNLASLETGWNITK